MHAWRCPQKGARCTPAVRCAFDACGSFPPRYPASEPFCRGSLPVDAPRRLAGRPATSRGETELTDVSPHPRAPVPLRCVKGGCGREKFSRPQETRSRAARLSQSSAYSLLSLSLSLYASPGPPTHPHPTRNYHSPHHPAAPPSRRKDNCRGRMCKPTHPPRRSAMPGQFLGQVTLRVCLLNVCQVGTPLGPPERHKMNSRPLREFLRGYASLLAREEAGPRLVSSGPFPRTRVIPAFPPFLSLRQAGGLRLRTSSPSEPSPACPLVFRAFSPLR